MSKRKTEINPIRADRVKELIQREKITQKGLAKLIHQTPQNINRICNKQNALTEDTAKEIIKAFPQYRYEWLMGIDDFMTKADFWKNGVLSECATQNSIKTLLSDAFVELSQFQKTDVVQNLSDIPQEEYELMEAQIRDFAKCIAWNYLHQENSHFWRREKRIDEKIMMKETEGEYYG